MKNKITHKTPFRHVFAGIKKKAGISSYQLKKNINVNEQKILTVITLHLRPGQTRISYNRFDYIGNNLDIVNV